MLDTQRQCEALEIDFFKQRGEKASALYPYPIQPELHEIAFLEGLFQDRQVSHEKRDQLSVANISCGQKDKTSWLSVKNV